MTTTPETLPACSACGAALVAEDCPNYGHGAEHAVDTTSSASRQHYIDTGRYLPLGATL